MASSPSNNNDETHTHPIGNPEYDRIMELEGYHGHFRHRRHCKNPFVYVHLITENIFNGSYHTLNTVLKNLLRAKKNGYFSEEKIVTLAHQNATHLANGVMLSTYLKVRNCNYMNQESLHLAPMPRVTGPIRIPMAFELAISKLGNFHVSSTVERKTVIPTANADRASRFFMQEGYVWSDSVYAEAVDFAEKLGLIFQAVDLTVNVGTGWWLLRPRWNGDYFFELLCALPSDNFTCEGAILYSLFMCNGNGEPEYSISDTSVLGDRIYGSILRAPPPRFNVDSFNAVEVVKPSL